MCSCAARACTCTECARWSAGMSNVEIYESVARLLGVRPWSRSLRDAAAVCRRRDPVARACARELRMWPHDMPGAEQWRRLAYWAQASAGRPMLVV